MLEFAIIWGMIWIKKKIQKKHPFSDRNTLGSAWICSSLSKVEAISVSVAFTLKYNKVFSSSPSKGDQSEAWTEVMFYPYSAWCCPLQDSICNSSSPVILLWRVEKFPWKKKKKSPQALAAPHPPLNQSGYYIDAPQFREMDNQAKMLLIPRVFMCK